MGYVCTPENKDELIQINYYEKIDDDELQIWPSANKLPSLSTMVVCEILHVYCVVRFSISRISELGIILGKKKFT